VGVVLIMAKITGYLLSFWVDVDGVVSFRVDVVCDDWYSDDEVVAELERVLGPSVGGWVGVVRGGGLDGLLADSFISDVSVVGGVFDDWIDGRVIQA